MLDPRLRAIRALTALTLSLTLGCAAPDESADSGDPIDLSAWTGEVIALPSGFAPDLPNGVESLLFAPDWRAPDSEFFWSYVFAMWIDGSVPDTDALDAMFESYYDGLIRAVAGGKGRDVGEDPADVRVTYDSPGAYRATIEMPDAFGDFETVKLNVRIDAARDAGNSTVLRVRASPQPVGHEVWRSLEAAVASIERPQ